MTIELTDSQLENARRLGSATLHEAAGKIGALPSMIKPLRHDWRIAAPVFTVVGPPQDNLWLHHAIYAAPKFVFAPILFLWFNTGFVPRVILVVTATFPVVTIFTISGIRTVNPNFVTALRMEGASRSQVEKGVTPSGFLRKSSSLPTRGSNCDARC